VRDGESLPNSRAQPGPSMACRRRLRHFDGTLSLAGWTGREPGDNCLGLLATLALLLDSTAGCWGQQLTEATHRGVDRLTGRRRHLRECDFSHQARNRHRRFERLFAMPQRLDHRAWRAAHWVPPAGERLDDLAQPCTGVRGDSGPAGSCAPIAGRMPSCRGTVARPSGGHGHRMRATLLQGR